MPDATVVTGYVPLPCTHRTAADYAALGARLLDVCQDAVFFRTPLHKCWLYRDGIVPGGKDSPAYHVVQHQKSFWLAAAAAATSSQTLVWIDYGAMHNAALTATVVTEFLDAVARKPPDRITSPSGIGGPPDASYPCWTFLGTVLAMPRSMAGWFHDQCVMERPMPTTWEINTWAAIHARSPEHFRLYAADHNGTLMTRYAA